MRELLVYRVLCGLLPEAVSALGECNENSWREILTPLGGHCSSTPSRRSRNSKKLATIEQILLFQDVKIGEGGAGQNDLLYIFMLTTSPPPLLPTVKMLKY